MSTHRDALARTTLLLNQEWFSERADEDAIADALLASTIRLTADRESMSCRAGQSALVSAFILSARLGIAIELRVPNVSLIDRVAPLRAPRLLDALLELGDDLIPGARVRVTDGEVDETFAFASRPERDLAAIRVSASDTEALLERGGTSNGCSGELPFGGFAGGAAVAALALDAGRARIERAVGLTVRTPRPSHGPPVRIVLEDLFPGLAQAARGDLGRVDVISGGAITHALIYCLLRVPTVRTQLRVIEKQAAEISNVNRYSLLRASQEDIDKLAVLEAAGNERLQISGAKTLFTRDTRAGLLPLAPRVLVGADDVEARWWVQEVRPAWLAVGATSNHVAQLTTHIPDSACAACLHPVALAPTTIPTISFVSFWAGLLQTCALLQAAATPPVNLSVFPFALGGSSWLISTTPAANLACPIECVAARRKAL